MVNSENQLGLFSKRTTVLKLPDADIEYIEGFYSDEEALGLYQHLLEHISWRQEKITVFGKTHLTPRLTCWMGDAGLDYRYSNMTMTPVPWSPMLTEIKHKLESCSGLRFNSVLLNYYRNGQDSNGWHSDDEPELGPDPEIASLSFGAARDFDLRHKQNRSQKFRISLQNGSLLLMRGATQRCWQHHIPKRANSEGRINLTFRTIRQ